MQRNEQPRTIGFFIIIAIRFCTLHCIHIESFMIDKVNSNGQEFLTVTYDYFLQ